MELSRLSYAKRHQVLLSCDHRLVELLITYEHLQLLHARATLLCASLLNGFVSCVGVAQYALYCAVALHTSASKRGPSLKYQDSCRRHVSTFEMYLTTREQTTLDQILYLHLDRVRTKTIIIKGYVAVFVFLSVKAVHLEPVTELTTSSFIATLRRFIARRGMPATIWSNNGTNFVGLPKRSRSWLATLKCPITAHIKASTGSLHQSMHAPHFGGLWEAAVKSFKQHLRIVVGEAKLTYEELATSLTQIEACLNSRPLTPLPYESEGMEVLIQGHFLIGKPLTALPDPPESRLPITML